MMKRNLYLAIGTFLFFAIFLTACRKKKDPVPYPENASNVEVYVVGNDKQAAQLWKNGIATALPSGIDANDIVLNGKDVFVSGHGQSNSNHYVAKYWKNGATVDLTDGTRNAFANGIFVNGSDIYVAGREEIVNGFTYRATYWKNGVAVVLGDATENSSLAAIAVVGNDVYAIGKHSKNGISSVACYWKNGILTDLSNESTYAIDQAMVVSGTDIYMAWSATYNNEGAARTSYTKNFGTPIVIRDAAQNFRGISIAVSGTFTYVAGFGIDPNGTTIRPNYFKGDQGVLINDGPNSAFAMSIAFDKNDVYVAGWTENIPTGSSPTACFWKNGSVVLLGSRTSQSLARKIVIMPK